MLSKFFSKRTPRRGPLPETPSGRRVYAIGDVHGRLDLLDRLLVQIDADNRERSPAKTQIVFLGDLIDRGPNSSGVIERVRTLAAGRGDVRVLMGNHEEVFLASLQGDIAALRFFCRIGGRETILSYGIDQDHYEQLEFEELAELLTQLVPPEHIAFVSEFEDVIIEGGYVFVHAGLRPQVPIADQHQRDLRWIREAFLNYRGDFEAFVVHGHTILADVDEQSNRIGIDTGAYVTGKLTALGLEGPNRWLLQT